MVKLKNKNVKDLKQGARMEKVIIFIEKTGDLFTAYSVDITGLTGSGYTVEEVKESVLECIGILKEIGSAPPELYESYEIVYEFID